MFLADKQCDTEFCSSPKRVAGRRGIMKYYTDTLQYPDCEPRVNIQLLTLLGLLPDIRLSIVASLLSYLYVYMNRGFESLSMN